uniref:Uncharacterized protein n=1 Tax=Itsystermes virus TaxID=2796596 RepID=A0A7T7GUV9_9VIRU|nr:hypothetical protein [Itsystermes virus]
MYGLASHMKVRALRKVWRLCSLVKDEEALFASLPVSDNQPWRRLVTLAEDPKAYEETHLRAFPPHVSQKTDEILRRARAIEQAMSKARKEVLDKFSLEEEELRQKLKAVRAQRAAFESSLRAQFKPLAAVESLRKEGLPTNVRLAADRKYHGSDDLQKRYTFGGYLEVVTQTYVAKQEKGLADSFLCLGSTEAAAGTIKALVPQRFEQTEKAAQPESADVSFLGLSSLDDDD